MKSFFKGIGILIFAVVIGCCLGCFSVLWAAPAVISSASQQNPVVIAVVSSESKVDFETKVEPLLKEQVKDCSVCVIRNVTPYDESGAFIPTQVPQQLELAGSSSSFFFVNWNAKASDEYKPISEAIKKLVHAGAMVIASAGFAKPSEATLPLNKTWVGQTPGVVIIGELAERETLLPQAFFGPQMLTAIKPPKEYIGQGMGPLFFVSKLATQWNKRTSDQWQAHFRNTKGRVRRIWPSLNDFF